MNLRHFHPLWIWMPLLATIVVGALIWWVASYEVARLERPIAAYRGAPCPRRGCRNRMPVSAMPVRRARKTAGDCGVHATEARGHARRALR